MAKDETGIEVAERYSNSIASRKQEALEDQAEKDKQTKKEAILVIEGIKNNMIAMEKVKLFDNQTKIITPGFSNYNLKNEPVFRVLMVGEITDTYATKVKVGDLVIVSNALAYKHNAVTQATFDSGNYAGLYYIANINDVVLKVKEYKKI